MKFEGLLFNTQILVESRDNFNERAHDKWEETNTGKHDQNTNDLLSVGDWEQIAVANGRQGGNWKVARCDELVLVRVHVGLVQVVYRDERVIFIGKDLVLRIR